MIPRDQEFDVFVSEGALVEVWRGERLSVAQQFGTDWDGPVHSVLHAALFCPPPGTPAPAAVPRCWSRELGICVAMCLGAAIGALLWFVSTRGWW